MDPRVVKFFLNYLVGRRTQYFWNNFSSPIFNVDIGVGQGLALSSFLSAIYIAPFLHILENHLKILKISISILSFVDDRLLVAQSKSFSISNSLLFCSYNIISSLLSRFGLIVKHSKTKVFHFTTLYGSFNPPPLNLSFLGGPILYSKDTWKYLGFIFNRKLLFHQHIDFYSNKAISTVKCTKILGNLVRSLIPYQKHLLYRSCILPITLYGFQLWFYNKAPLLYSLKILGKLQKRVAIWILGVFKTFPSFSNKAIAGLIPINLHLQKLSGRLQLRSHSLLHNNILRFLMEPKTLLSPKLHSLSLGSLSKHQRELIKGSVVDMDNHFNEVFSFFNFLNPEFTLGCRIINNFSSHFLFNLFSKCYDNNLKSQIYQLDNMTIKSLSNLFYVLTIMDINVKNNITTSISHIYIWDKPITKTLHYTINITSTEVKLFAIRCGVN